MINVTALQADVSEEKAFAAASSAVSADGDAPTAALLRGGGGDQGVTAASAPAGPAAGAPIPGSYIVVYKPGTDLEAATQA